MKREIKFRGLSIESGEWVYGSLMVDEKYSYMMPEDMNLLFPFKFDDFLPITPETVGQFTGLQDKNGKDIYEGGVVENDNGTSYIVVYDADYFGFFLKRLGADVEEPEHIYGDEVHCFALRVIGNIHEEVSA